MSIRNFWARAFSRKPPPSLLVEEDDNHRRNFTMFDVLCIGIGGTVGTGIFALSGMIAREEAGPAIVLCWGLGGVAALLSGFSYMELCTRYPNEGNTYTFSFHLLGELPAAIAASLLTLECGISGSAVARTFADKVHSAVLPVLGSKLSHVLTLDYFNIVAGGSVMIICLILALGIDLGKRTINVMTVFKCLLIVFMTVLGFSQWNSDNIVGKFPPPRLHGRYGWQGVLSGTTQLFLGYIGFDEVCCLAAETQNPRKTLPLALVGTLIAVAVSSMVACLALVGMQNYTELDPVQGFASAFAHNKLHWAAVITQLGEVVNLPIVIMICFVAQPRIQLLMSRDGLLPPFLGKTEANGNPRNSIVASGIFCGLFALLVPFKPLNNLVSVGALMSFNFANACLIVARRWSENNITHALVLLFNICIAITCFVAQIVPFPSIPVGVLLLLSVSVMLSIHCLCRENWHNSTVPPATFHTPFVPFIPCIATSLNWYLVAQIGWPDLRNLLCWVLGAASIWVLYGFTHTKVKSGVNSEWQYLLSPTRLPAPLEEAGEFMQAVNTSPRTI